MRIGSLFLTVIKFVLVVLLLGLGVHFGFFTPRGNFTPEYIGIFGNSYLNVVVATCLIYLFYRSFVLLYKIRALKQKISNENLSEKDQKKHDQQISEYVVREVFLFLFISIPIIVGIEWIKNPVDITSGDFHFWRNVFALTIILFVVMFYREKVNIS